MTTHDWRLLDIEGVVDAIERAATKVAHHYELEVDDLIQDATIMVCDLSTDLPAVIEDTGILQYRLERDLIDRARTSVSQRERNTSYEARYEEADESYPAAVAAPRQFETSLYTRELVEALLPAVWDESYAYGMRAENAPDQDMPRGSSNKATGNTLAAHIADIRRAWSMTDLHIHERRSLFLTYAVDWAQKEIAYNQRVSQPTVSDRVNNGVGKIVAFLNGDVALFNSLTDEQPALFELGAAA